MKRMMNDEVILRMGINVFDLQKKYNKAAILEFMKMGGLELLDKVMIDHAEDLFLVDQIPPFKRSILSEYMAVSCVLSQFFAYSCASCIVANSSLL
jgi:hypothetical protein